MATKNDEANDSKWICKICLDRLKKPVVTQCGHLFCWGCLYKWLDRQLSCPVCQGEINKDMITPIYGHDEDSKEGNDDTERESKSNEDIPSRPAGNRQDPPPRRRGNFEFHVSFGLFGLFDILSQAFTHNNEANFTEQEQKDEFISKGIVVFLLTAIVLILCGMI